MSSFGEFGEFEAHNTSTSPVLYTMNVWCHRRASQRQPVAQSHNGLARTLYTWTSGATCKQIQVKRFGV